MLLQTKKAQQEEAKENGPGNPWNQAPEKPSQS
jgi:hypothetical protein